MNGIEISRKDMRRPIIMDIATIIGLISSLLTIEEDGRGWTSGLFHFCKKKHAKKKIVFVEWDTKDESAQRLIDAFKCKMAAKYKEHIFQPDEIDTIIKELFKEKAYLFVDDNQRKDISYFQRKHIFNFHFCSPYFQT